MLGELSRADQPDLNPGTLVPALRSSSTGGRRAGGCLEGFAKHLQGYLDSYAFRYNHRNDLSPLFLTLLGRIARQPA